LQIQAPPLPMVHSRLGALHLGPLLPTGLSPGQVPQVPPPRPGPRTRGTVQGPSPGQAPPPLLKRPQTPAQPMRPTAGRVVRVSPAAQLRTSLRPAAPRALLRNPLLLMQPPDPLGKGPPSVSAAPRALLRAPLLLKLPCQLHLQASLLEALQHLAHLAGFSPQPWQMIQPHLRPPPLLPHQGSPSSGQTPLPQVPPPLLPHPGSPSSGQEPLPQVAAPPTQLVVSHSPRTRLLLLLSLEP